LSAPGPHAILLVVGIGRFTEEERETVRLLQKAFGYNMIKYLIVVFTRKDDLDRNGKDLKELIETAPPALKNILADCNNRCVALNNAGDEAEREEQVLDLFTIIDKVISENGGGFYTSTIFHRCEDIIQLREEEIRGHNHADYKRQISDIEHEASEDYREKIIPVREEEQRYRHELQLLCRHRQDLSESDPRNSRQSFRRSRSSADVENTDVLIEQKVMELETKLSQIQKQQDVIKASTQHTLQQRESEVRCKLHELNSTTRGKVRKEIEKGDSGILKRIWGRITEAGHDIIDKFRSIFETLKHKFENI